MYRKRRGKVLFELNLHVHSVVVIADELRGGEEEIKNHLIEILFSDRLYCGALIMIHLFFCLVLSRLVSHSSLPPMFIANVG